MLDTSKLDLEAKQRFIQFELWKDCHNDCAFCFNKGLPDCDKAWSIKEVLKQLENPQILLFNEIGFIGGEFFAHQIDSVKDLFYSLFDKVLSMHFERILLTTSLIYKPFQLIEFLEYLEKKQAIEKILLCTSYDTIGRFHNLNAHTLWCNNVHLLHNLYPKLKIHVEQIVTNDFCEQVLNGQFDIKAFAEGYNVHVDYLEPNTGGYYKSKEEFEKACPNFLLKRSTFLKWLVYVFKNNLVNKEDLFNRKLRSDVIYLTKCNQHFEICGRHKGTKDDMNYFKQIGQVPQFGYIDSDIPIWQDVKMIKEMFE